MIGTLNCVTLHMYLCIQELQDNQTGCSGRIPPEYQVYNPMIHTSGGCSHVPRRGQRIGGDPANFKGVASCSTKKEGKLAIIYM